MSMSKRLSGRGQAQVRLFALLAATVMLVSLSSGCINAYWTKNLLNPAQPKIVLKNVQTLEMVYFFKTNPTDLSTLTKQMSNNTKIIDGTRWMRVDIRVMMQQVPPQIQPWIQEIENFLKINITRHVTINITMPDGTGWFDKTINATSNTTIFIETPEVGDWTFTINAVGLGSDAASTHDGFKIIAHAYEPIKIY